MSRDHYSERHASDNRAHGSAFVQLVAGDEGNRMNGSPL
jgi:hypothetical protein